MNFWNLDTILDYLKIHGAEIGEDNDGQIVIYTNLTSVRDDGFTEAHECLKDMDTHEIIWPVVK